MFFSDNFLKCKYIDQCSGCQIAHLDPTAQIDFKKNKFIDLWKKTFSVVPEIEFRRPIEAQFRDRVDLTIQRPTIPHGAISNSSECKQEYQKLGFYKKDSRDILDIESCPLMSKGTSDFYTEVRKIHFPIQKGSLRIRVSPAGKRGIWLDFANEDIKKLLEEKNTLIELTKICDVVEIGQKRKKLSQVEGQFKLTDPESIAWFETYDKNLNPIELKMNVGSFSQTGFKTNKALISELFKVLNPTAHNQIHDQKWIELCSGSGNLTFPLLSVFSNVIATELDENAVESLRTTAKNLNLSGRLQVEQINIHKPSQKLEDLLSGVDGILADPPRSGLQGFLEVISRLQKEKLPKKFVYVSCFAETLIYDLKILNDLGYNPNKIIGIDQFPHSTHCEWIVSLSRY